MNAPTLPEEYPEVVPEITHCVKIVTEARRWCGTPFHHGASRCGVGTDCLGLIRGVWRAVCGPEPETPVPYAPDWAEATGRETMLEAAARHLIPVSPLEGLTPGRVVLFRLRRGGPARHAGIVASDALGLTLIHAWSGRVVVEEPYAPRWPRLAAHAFAYPHPSVPSPAEIRS